MALNPRGSFTLDLSLFGSLVQDIKASDLPAGVSPDNADCFYLPGSVFTRPAFKKCLATPVINDPVIMSNKNYSSPAGDALTMFMDSTGLLYSNDAADNTNTRALGQFSPGVQFKAENAFGKQWYAFYSYLESSAFSDNPFVGVDPPSYFNGTDMFRVTSDAPGAPPSFSNLFQGATPVVQSAITGTLTVASGMSTGRVDYNDGGPIFTYYTSLTYTCTTPVPANWMGKAVTIDGFTGGGYSGEDADILNTSGVIVGIDGNDFTIYRFASLFASLNTGTITATVSGDFLVRQNNIVRAYLGSTAPQNMTPGFWVSVLNSNGSLINEPSWTIDTISRDAKGLVTVTLTSALANLPVGASMFISPTANTVAGTGSVTTGSAVFTHVSGPTFDESWIGQVVVFGGGAGAHVVTAVTSSTTLVIDTNFTATTTISFNGTFQYFSPGYQTVYQVLPLSSGKTVFTFQSLNSIPATSSAGGAVYQTWSPQQGTHGNAGLIINSGTDDIGYFIEYFQLGPDIGSGAGDPQVQIQAQAAAGGRSGVVIFASKDGALTAPSVPAQLSLIGGSNLLLAQNIPIGPPGTARRILAFTPKEGSSYYYITPAIIPQTGTQSPVIALGTIVNDNITTSAILDFSDEQLVSSTQIDIEGNNLFNQVVLAPCLGVIEYQGRMAWWGEINNVKNFVNPGFDGGYVPQIGNVTVVNGSPLVAWESGTLFNDAWVNPTEILIGGVSYTISSIVSNISLSLTTNFGQADGVYPYVAISPQGSLPLGWDSSAGDGLGTLVFYTGDSIGGFVYEFKGGTNSKIQQGCVKDYYGAPILNPDTDFIVRFRATTNGAASPPGNLNIDLYSPSLDQVLSSAVFAVSALGDLTGALIWSSSPMSQKTPEIFTVDTVVRLYLSGTDAASSVFIDELEFIYADQPVSFDQMRLSYFQNPFGFDAITGIMSLDPSENIVAAFRQRGYLYILSDESLFQSQNNGVTEPVGWNVVQYVGVCGAAGPNAVDFAEEVAYWAGRYGGRVFSGDPVARKITQEIAPTWESINWTAKTTMWVANDPVNRLVFFGIPTGGTAMPNKVLQLSYRLSDDAYNIPDPVHVSSISARMVATDLGRRWSPWNISMNSAAMCVRELPTGLAQTMVFGGGNGQAPGEADGFGNLYSLDMFNYPPTNPDASEWNCIDDDYGTINSYYIPYFFYNHDVEQQPMMGQYRHIFNYLALHLTGIGSIRITPYIDSLSKPQTTLPLTPLSFEDPGFDLEWHPITKGNRVAYKIEPYIGAPGVGKCFALTHMLVSGRRDMVFPVRGSIFGA